MMSKVKQKYHPQVTKSIYLRTLTMIRCSPYPDCCALPPRRRELRTAADERVHHAVVPHALRHLPAQGHGAADLGQRAARGLRDHAANRARHLEQAAGVRLEIALR